MRITVDGETYTFELREVNHYLGKYEVVCDAVEPFHVQNDGEARSTLRRVLSSRPSGSVRTVSGGLPERNKRRH
jgi:hypothetical protein